MGNLFVAILLLLSTLSSNPLGSMEQSAPEPGVPLAHATALPLVRAPDAAAELQAPRGLAPEPPGLPLHPASAAPARRRPPFSSGSPTSPRPRLRTRP